MKTAISATVLTKNSEKHIRRCLESLRAFDEVLVLDNGSTDQTMIWAREYPNVKVVEHPFIGFGPLKRKAVDFAKNDWIFSIDSDEAVTPKLLEEIAQLDLNDATQVFKLPRDNYYKDEHIKACGWYPDLLVRLFNRRHTNFDEAMIHEQVVIRPNSQLKKLRGSISHFAFDRAGQLIEKMQKYSELYAETTTEKSSLSKAVVRSLIAFIKSYFIKRGFLYGYKGLVISVSNANGTFFKYLKAYERQYEKKHRKS
ncbi:MAG: glycosyltransferase family 2 protein [Bdellovibrionia bacterium]